MRIDLELVRRTLTNYYAVVAISSFYPLNYRKGTLQSVPSQNPDIDHSWWIWQYDASASHTEFCTAITTHKKSRQPQSHETKSVMMWPPSQSTGRQVDCTKSQPFNARRRDQGARYLLRSTTPQFKVRSRWSDTRGALVHNVSKGFLTRTPATLFVTPTQGTARE